jgi:SAM-dependent methyltransferase
MSNNLQISKSIHPSDFMYQFLMMQNGNNVQKAEDSYFGGGQYDTNMVREVAEKFGVDLANRCVLEFASGYGRITRHFGDIADNYITADIHPEAVKFIRTDLNRNSILSTARHQDFTCDFKFSFIYVLSLFSHLPKESFCGWLETLYQKLNPGGILLFTTHGEAAASKSNYLKEILDPISGFGFVANSEQKDLPAENYGTTVSSKTFVAAVIQKLPEAKILSFKSGVWFGLQDEWVVIKSK